MCLHWKHVRIYICIIYLRINRCVRKEVTLNYGFILLKVESVRTLTFLCSPKTAYSRRLVRPYVSPSVSQSIRPYVPFVSGQKLSKLFHRNDHHTETTCRAQHLGRYLEGQGHSMTLQQNRVRPITSLLEVGI